MFRAAACSLVVESLGEVHAVPACPHPIRARLCRCSRCYTEAQPLKAAFSLVISSALLTSLRLASVNHHRYPHRKRYPERFQHFLRRRVIITYFDQLYTSDWGLIELSKCLVSTSQTTTAMRPSMLEECLFPRPPAPERLSWDAYSMVALW